MKSAIFFMALGMTIVASMWSAVIISMPYALRAQSATTIKDRVILTAYSIASFWIVASGPLSLLFIILTYEQ